MKYKDRNTLLKSDYDDLSSVEKQEFNLIVNEEVNSIISRFGFASKDFKQLLLYKLTQRVA